MFPNDTMVAQTCPACNLPSMQIGFQKLLMNRKKIPLFRQAKVSTMLSFQAPITQLNLGVTFRFELKTERRVKLG